MTICPQMFSRNISVTRNSRNVKLCTHTPDYLGAIVSKFDVFFRFATASAGGVFNTFYHHGARHITHNVYNITKLSSKHTKRFLRSHPNNPLVEGCPLSTPPRIYNPPSRSVHQGVQRKKKRDPGRTEQRGPRKDRAKLI